MTLESMKPSPKIAAPPVVYAVANPMFDRFIERMSHLVDRVLAKHDRPRKEFVARKTA